MLQDHITTSAASYLVVGTVVGISAIPGETIGKSSINGPFSIAMLDYRRVNGQGKSMDKRSGCVKLQHKTCEKSDEVDLPKVACVFRLECDLR